MATRSRSRSHSYSVSDPAVKASPEEELLAQLIGLLEAGVSPWQRPWSSPLRYQNLVSGHAFSGGNPALLAMQCAARASTDRLFCTATQARSKGWHPAKGSKCYRIFQPVPITIRPDESAGGEGQGAQEGAVRSFTRFRAIPLFAASDLAGDGVTDAINATVSRLSETFTHQPLVALERLSPWEAHIHHDPSGDRAFYAPALDRITLPAASRFAHIEHYGATLCHELIHLSGHRSRLDRPGITSGCDFGSPEYAEEELIAEVGAFLLCEDLGIGSVIERHASYLDSWLQVLSRGPRALTSTLSAAARAAKLILPPVSSDA